MIRRRLSGHPGLVRFGYRHLPGGPLSPADIGGWGCRARVVVASAGDDRRQGSRPETALKVASRFDGLRELGGAARNPVAVPSIQVRNDRGESSAPTRRRRRQRSALVALGRSRQASRTCWCCSMPTRPIGWTSGKAELKGGSGRRVCDVDVFADQRHRRHRTVRLQRWDQPARARLGADEVGANPQHDRLHQSVRAGRDAPGLSQRVRKTDRPSPPRSQ